MIAIWVRHGENLANLNHTFSYRIYDEDLTDLGREQAQQAAETLYAEGDRPAAVVSSPLRRARQTAQIIAARFGLPVAEELDDLRELNVGELDARSDDAGWAVHDAVIDAWRRGEAQVGFPGGEDLDGLLARTRRALAHLAATYPDGPLVVVAHGGNIRCSLPGLTGCEPLPSLRNCETVRLELTAEPPGGVDVRLLQYGWADRELPAR